MEKKFLEIVCQLLTTFLCWASRVTRISLLRKYHVLGSAFRLPISQHCTPDKFFAFQFLMDLNPNKGLYKVLRHKVTRLFSARGLALRDITCLNFVLILRHFQYIVIDKESIWFKQIHGIYIIWTTRTSHHWSWCLRSISRVREICKQMISYHIANGTSIKLWPDPQFNSQVLSELIDDLRLEYPLGQNSRLSSWIQNGQWNIGI